MELKTIGLTKKFSSKTAVDNLNITLTNGVYGLLGANGAGKTTLMRLLCNIQNPTSGRILLNEKNIVGLGERYRNLLGYLPQHFGYYPDFSAYDFLRYVSALKGLDEKAAHKKSKELLEAVDLSRESKHKIKTFSGGMKQRLGFAQAMLNDPHILILDEPAAGLDPVAREEMADMLLDFVSDENHTVFVSSHIITDLEKICDYITFIDKGKILLSGEKDEIKDNYAIVKGDLSLIDPDKIISKHITDYSSRALVYKDDLPKGENFTVEKPTLEDIMVFYVRR